MDFLALHRKLAEQQTQDDGPVEIRAALPRPRPKPRPLNLDRPEIDVPISMAALQNGAEASAAYLRDLL